MHWSRFWSDFLKWSFPHMYGNRYQYLRITVQFKSQNSFPILERLRERYRTVTSLSTQYVVYCTACYRIFFFYNFVMKKIVRQKTIPIYVVLTDEKVVERATFSIASHYCTKNYSQLVTAIVWEKFRLLTDSCEILHLIVSSLKLW